MANRSPVRDWVREAAANTVPSLLCDVGCARLTVDDIARRLGLAKGALYFSQQDVADVIAATLDAWTTELTSAPRLSDDSFKDACRLLFERALESDTGHAAMPCCLATSPCPHGWPGRWRRIAIAMGLGQTDLALTLGDAVQAIASHPDVRGLLESKRIDEAVEVVLAVIGFEEENGD